MQGIAEWATEAHHARQTPMRVRAEGIALVAGCCLLIAASAIFRPQADQEAIGRTIVMAARGWQEWPKEPALPACEWDATGNFHLVTPCEEDGGLVFYRNPWIPKRWATTQRREL